MRAICFIQETKDSDLTIQEIDQAMSNLLLLVSHSSDSGIHLMMKFVLSLPVQQILMRPILIIFLSR